MTPTPEQHAILDAARMTESDILVSALAGAAKTSTLVMIAEALPTTSILCLAFNKRIAEEMTARLPDNCHAMTLNSLGHRVWGQHLSRRLILVKDKTYTILSGLIEDLPKDDRTEAFDGLADLIRAVDMGKMWGYIPSGKFPTAKRLIEDDDFFAALEIEPTTLQMDLIQAATIEGIKRALAGEIDFSDQIFMPTLFGATFPQYPLVLVDEAQDLSPLNHATLRRLARKRLIAVGDECQSIYGFRGAAPDSMSLLRKTFAMTELRLSISFRCPTSVVREAQWRAPHMRWPEWAKAGVVEHLDHWSAAALPDNCTIICRNNAPLFSTAVRLLRDGRYPQVVGNDIGKSLIKVLKKLGPPAMKQAEVLTAIAKWADGRKRKVRNKALVEDQAECLRVFAHQGPTLNAAIAYAEHILAAHGPIQLMTIHKAKGLEFDNVYILDRELVRDEREQQEANLLYVAQTRSKANLTYIESSGYMASSPRDTYGTQLEAAPTV